MINTIVNLHESFTHINESIDLVSLEIHPLARIIYFFGVAIKSPHLQDGSRLTFSYISFPSVTFHGALYRIFLLFLRWLPCHLYLVVTEQQLWCLIQTV